MKTEEILLEASTTINLYYNNPEWLSIVQDLHKRFGLKTNISWKESQLHSMEYYSNNIRNVTNNKRPFVPVTYMLIYDKILVIFGNRTPQSGETDFLIYDYDHKILSDSNEKYSYRKLPRAVYKADVSVRDVISPKKRIPKKLSDTYKIQKEILTFLLPIMEKYIVKSMADIEGIIMQYIKSGNYNTARQKLDRLYTLDSVRSLFNTSRPLKNTEGITIHGDNIIAKQSFIFERFTIALKEAYMSSKKDSDLDYSSWLENLRSNRRDLREVIDIFYELLLR